MKAGLEDRIGQYKWTSHSGYLSKAKKWSWLHKRKVLDILSRDSDQQRKAYLDFMSEADSKEVHEFYSRKNVKPILGSSEFLQRIKDGFSDILFHEDIPAARSLRSGVAEVIAAVSSVYETEPETIRSLRRGRENEARDVAILLARNGPINPCLPWRFNSA